MTYKEIRVWSEWMIVQLGGTPAAPAAPAANGGPVRLSSKAEIRSFFGLREGGTEILVSNS